MKDLWERQRQFAAALLDPDVPVPPGLVGPDHQPDTRRFNVYRNKVVVGLIEALKASFPAVLRIVGDAFFTAMAHIYVAQEPPKTPVMLDYGATFADFVQAFEPAGGLPYLADVARIERAWVEAYHAAEVPRADLALLCALDSQRLAQMRLTLHPSVRVVRSSFPVVQIWLMNGEGGVPAPVDIFRGGEHALVMRPDAEVEVRRVTAGAATFVQGLMAGASMAEATRLALDDDPAFDLAPALAELFAVHAIVAWHAPEDAASMPASIPIVRCA
jgi:hypothetical protein